MHLFVVNIHFFLNIHISFIRQKYYICFLIEVITILFIKNKKCYNISVEKNKRGYGGMVDATDLNLNNILSLFKVF
jgi:hypothetical protein